MDEEKPSILALRASIQAYTQKIKREVVEEDMISEITDSYFEETAQDLSVRARLGSPKAPNSREKEQCQPSRTTKGATDVSVSFSHQDATQRAAYNKVLQEESFEKMRAQMCEILRGQIPYEHLYPQDFSNSQGQVKPDESWENLSSSETSAVNEVGRDHEFLNSNLDPPASVLQSQKGYRCNICGKSFSKLRSFTDHLTIHTGAKPYKCDLCNRDFARISLMSSHLKTHSDVRSFKCDECDKAFRQCSNLIVHKRTHSGYRPYQCDQCDAGFVKTGDLVRHKRVHTGERLYSCDVCEKSFVRSSTLTVHKRQHSGERPYQCDVCDKGFYSSSHLTRHKKVHSKNKLWVVIRGVESVHKHEPPLENHSNLDYF